MTVVIVVFALALTLAVLLLIGSYAAYRMAFYTDRKKERDPFYAVDAYPEYTERRRELINRTLSLPYEEVSITSHDGLKLYARYIHVRDGAPLEIQFHGYKSLSVRDFSASGLECFKEGYNLLLVDQRAHGKSEGKVISFGINERRDCIAWVNYARARFGVGQKIVLLGISMGAATVLMAAGDERLSGVCAVVADCPYSSQTDIIKLVAKKMHIPKWITAVIAPIGARIFGGFSLGETTPRLAALRAKVPLLLIHGEADDFVPCEMSKEIAESNPNIKIETFPDAGHGFSYLVDTERYRRVVREFIAAAIEKDEN